MSKEILLVVDAVSNEKGVNREIIFEAIETALATATRKKYGSDIDVRVNVNHEDGSYRTYRRWEIVDNLDTRIGLEFPMRQITREAAKVLAEEEDNYVEEEIQSVKFGRIAAQIAKQVIKQVLRDAERAKIVNTYKDRVGDLISGIVKRLARGAVILDLGNNAEAEIPKNELIPRESVRVGDRVRGYLYEVNPEYRGPQLFISRTQPGFLISLFRLEVPEINDGLIEIHGAARDAGSRAKIAVSTKDQRIDPVGACVGMRGSRVQAVSNELAGERVDIILWNENIVQFVINAMAPADVVSIIVDEERNSMDVVVKEDNLSQAIGRGGQNVRLASQLTGWELNVMNEKEASEKNEAETIKYTARFMRDLDIDKKIATILAQKGFSSLEEIAYISFKDMLQIKEFDKDIINELRERANDVLLTKEISKQVPDEDLISIEGMDEKTAFKLAANGITSLEDLAEKSVSELLEIEDMDQERAGSLIMKARAPWFKKKNKEQKDRKGR